MTSNLLKALAVIWVLVTLFLGIEYLKLNQIITGTSYLETMSCQVLSQCETLDPDPGRPLSYSLGWLGFSILCLTNIYILRKRLPIFAKFGKLSTHLDIHIFFGLIGPTFILFHSNFKVGGLVAISFWSMVISFVSGIIGRYFYIQLLQKKSVLKDRIYDYENKFNDYLKFASDKGVKKKHLEIIKIQTFLRACGGVPVAQLNQMSVLGFFAKSLQGDLTLGLHMPNLPIPGGRALRYKIREWAFLRRKLIFMHYYNTLFGYWKTFHMPFAIFMYVVAIIHIISSLIFRVPN